MQSHERWKAKYKIINYNIGPYLIRNLVGFLVIGGIIVCLDSIMNALFSVSGEEERQEFVHRLLKTCPVFH